MTTSLTLDELVAIRALAAGDGQRRGDAVAAFHRVASAGVSRHGCAALRYMSEVLNPVPDLLLRARYRQELLATPLPG